MDTDMATDTDMAIRTATTSSHQTLSPIKKDLPTEVLFLYLPLPICPISHLFLLLNPSRSRAKVELQLSDRRVATKQLPRCNKAIA